ncbi:hypothetical protein DMUE_5310 [Dictyocoela muelleri]|nr:hypothetical protein DMUE_5310 [Dictyocoela muelleri]
MTVKTQINNISDNTIIEKSKILVIKTNEEIKELVKTAKRNNPRLGSIEIYKHKIELIKEFEINKKEYPVLIGLHDSVKEHLDELIKLGIIEERLCDKVSPAFY